MNKIGEGEREVQTSSYEMIKSQEQGTRIELMNYNSLMWRRVEATLVVSKA